MIRDLRNTKQAITDDEVKKVLNNGTSGVLALRGDDDYPYAVPLSYIYQDGKIFFHTSTQGHKLDAIKHYDKASFCVIAQDNVVPEEFTTYYGSVIAFGRIHIVEDDNIKRKAIDLIGERYSPESTKEERAAIIDRCWDALCILEFDIEKATGKVAADLAK